MSFTLYMPAFVDDVSVIPAAFLNKVRVDSSRAIDGTSGGAYAPAASLDIGGAGVDMQGLNHLLTGGLTVTGAGSNVVVTATGFVDIEATAGDVTWKGAVLDDLPKCDSRDYLFHQPIQSAHNNDSLGGSWIHDTGYWVNDAAIAGQAYLYIGLTNLPNRGTLKSATVYVKSTSHGANAPATKPSIITSEFVIATGAHANGNSTTDPETLPGNYDAYHSYSVAWAGGGLNQVLDGSTVPYLILTGETGANSVDDAYKLHAVVVEVTCTEIGPG